MACNITVTGNLGRDPELRYPDNATQPVAKFTVAARQAKVRGEEPPALWFTVEIWGGPAEWVANNLVKGDSVFVAGELCLRTWTYQETGEVRESLTIKRATVEKQWPAKEAGAAPASAAAPAPAATQAAAPRPAAGAPRPIPAAAPAAAPPRPAPSAFV